MWRWVRKNWMLNSRETWLAYFYYLICFLDIIFMPHRKPVSLWITIITYPNWPFPMRRPIAKSDFLNSRGVSALMERRGFEGSIGFEILLIVVSTLGEEALLRIYIVCWWLLLVMSWLRYIFFFLKRLSISTFGLSFKPTWGVIISWALDLFTVSGWPFTCFDSASEFDSFRWEMFEGCCVGRGLKGCIWFLLGSWKYVR